MTCPMTTPNPAAGLAAACAREAACLTVAAAPAEAAPAPPKQWLNPREAAAYLGCSMSFLALDRHRPRYRLPFTRLGCGVRYRVADLDAYLHSKRVNAVHANRPAKTKPAAQK